MENAHLTHADRLRAHGDRLLQALEDQDTPTSYAEILRAARALMAVQKALELLYRPTDDIETKAADGDDAEPAPLNRRMRRKAMAMARKAAPAATLSDLETAFGRR